MTAGNIRVSAAGTYLFADLTIDASTTAGPRTLRIVSPSGTTTATFTILPRLDTTGRFQGLGPDDVIYLAMPDRFVDGDSSNNDPSISPGLYDRSKPRYYHGGDFKGVTSKLPYLKDLGVTAVWLNPWYDNVNHLNQKETYDNQPITDYHGYGAVDFYGVEEHFGSMADLQALVTRAHALGLKVVQDQVANHTGPYHPWVDDSPTPTWFNGTAAAHVANTWQVWTLQDPHATAQEQRATLEGWFINILPDLNQQDDETARYIIQNALWWTGHAGPRCHPAGHMAVRPPRVLAAMDDCAEAEFPNVTAVGELFDEDPALVSFFIGGAARFDGVDTKVDSLFDFPLLGAIRQVFAKGGPVRAVVQVLARDHLYPDASKLTTFLGNHDMARFMNEPGATAAGLNSRRRSCSRLAVCRRCITVMRLACRVAAIPTTAGTCLADSQAIRATHSPPQDGRRRKSTSFSICGRCSICGRNSSRFAAACCSSCMSRINSTCMRARRPRHLS